MSASNPQQTPERGSLLQTIFRVLLGAALLWAGIAHLTVARSQFQAQVPGWVPLPDDFVVIASGIVELALGGALIALPRYRVVVGWIVAAFFVAVFPGNIAQYVDRVDGLGMTSDRSRAIRLLFQPVLIAWALWSTGAWRVLRKKRDGVAQRS